MAFLSQNKINNSHEIFSEYILEYIYKINLYQIRTDNTTDNHNKTLTVTH